MIGIGMQPMSGMWYMGGAMGAGRMARVQGVNGIYPGADERMGLTRGKTTGVQGSEECQTCKNRKYQDGSDEMVSFKTPGKISPEASYGKVMSHEQEHVANAIAEGSKKNKELVSATVTLKTAICPECGKSYVSGGTTRTVMKTYNDDAYSQNRKAMEQELFKGNNIDYSI